MKLFSRRNRRAFSLSVCLVAFVGCRPEPLPGESITAVVTTAADEMEAQGVADVPLLSLDGRELTIGEFEARSALLSEVARYKLDTPQSRTGLLEMFVWIEALGKLGTREGLIGGAEETLLGRENEARANLEASAGLAVDPSALDAEETAWFEAHGDLLQRPARRNILGIRFDDRARAAAIRDEMAGLLEHAGSAHVFRSMHASLDTGDDTLGEWGWVAHPDAAERIDSALADAIFALDIRTLSEVIETTRGFEVVWVVAEDPATELTFEEVEVYVHERVHAAARGEHMRRELDAARAANSVAIDAVVVARLDANRATPVEESRPRRYSGPGLSNAIEAELGIDELKRVNEGRDALVYNPNLTAYEPAPEAPEGSAELPETP